MHIPKHCIPLIRAAKIKKYKALMRTITSKNNTNTYTHKTNMYITLINVHILAICIHHQHPST